MQCLRSFSSLPPAARAVHHGAGRAAAGPEEPDGDGHPGVRADQCQDPEVPAGDERIAAPFESLKPKVGGENRVLVVIIVHRSQVEILPRIVANAPMVGWTELISVCVGGIHAIARIGLPYLRVL